MSIKGQKCDAQIAWVRSIAFGQRVASAITRLAERHNP